MQTIAPGLLIAAPMLTDPNFSHTVVLMCAHNEEGAMGLVINRPAPFTMREILQQLGLECTIEAAKSAMVGGPVAVDNGLLLYTAEDTTEHQDNELDVTDQLRLCPNKEILNSIGSGSGPEQYQMFLGHAGWGSGQLEVEIAQGAWIPATLRMDLIFSTPIKKRWDEALQGEGIHPAQFGSSRPQA